MKTFFLKPAAVKRRWYHVDASGVLLGKLATTVARHLMGKVDPCWTPSTDSGHFVVVTHAAKVRVTGKKNIKKVYRRYTGFPGGLVEESLGELLEENPARVIELAVRRMLPKTRQGRAQFKRLRVYAGAEHEHAAQRPVALEIKS
jgi:large subunit ribosomal protein L13